MEMSFENYRKVVRFNEKYWPYLTAIQQHDAWTSKNAKLVREFIEMYDRFYNEDLKCWNKLVKTMDSIKLIITDRFDILFED